MKINRDNYEAYLLDYFEKELDPATVAELMLFLEMNPDLKADFEEFENISLVPDTSISFPDKNSLKKTVIAATPDINEKNYEEYFIAAVENLLSPAETAQLNTFIAQNPALQKDYKLFTLTRLEPDTNVVFGDKDSLRRRKIIPFYQSRTMRYSAIAVAASLLIFVSVYFNLPKPVEAPGIAKVETKADNRIKQQEPSVRTPNTEAVAKAVQPEATHAGKLHNTNKKQEQNIALTPETISKPSLMTASTCGPLQLLPSENVFNATTSLEARTYFTDVYVYMRLREVVDYQQYLDEQENKAFFARAVGMIREKVLGKDLRDAQNTPADRNLWALANAGVKGINYLTNSNIEIRRKTDSDGNTTAYAIASNRFEYSKDLRK